MQRNRFRGETPLWASQVFLTCARTIKRLLGRTSIGAGDHVVEIGPGKGHITRRLAEKSGRVSAVELDGKLFAKLAAKFGGVDNLRLFHGDFLSWRLPAGEYKVFSNIPFCLTTDIVRKLTECKNPPVEMWLVMEKGAAKRFLGKPKENLRSLRIKSKFEMDIAYYFVRGDFHPCVAADIVLLHFKKKERRR